MTEFVATLRDRIETAGRALILAERAGDVDAVHRHSARLLDLLDQAASTDVDTSGWVPSSVLAAAAGNCA